MLAEHLSALDLEPGRRVFVPFCGKTRDIAWLLFQGFQVAASELSELPIQQLYTEVEIVQGLKCRERLSCARCDT